MAPPPGLDVPLLPSLLPASDAPAFSADAGPEPYEPQPKQQELYNIWRLEDIARAADPPSPSAAPQDVVVSPAASSPDGPARRARPRPASGRGRGQTRKPKGRRRKGPLKYVARLHTNFIRSLGACDSCRDRKIACKHHNTSKFEQAFLVTQASGVDSVPPRPVADVSDVLRGVGGGGDFLPQEPPALLGSLAAGSRSPFDGSQTVRPEDIYPARPPADVLQGDQDFDLLLRQCQTEAPEPADDAPAWSRWSVPRVADGIAGPVPDGSNAGDSNADNYTVAAAGPWARFDRQFEGHHPPAYSDSQRASHQHLLIGLKTPSAWVCLWPGDDPAAAPAMAPSFSASSASSGWSFDQNPGYAAPPRPSGLQCAQRLGSLRELKLHYDAAHASFVHADGAPVDLWSASTAPQPVPLYGGAQGQYDGAGQADDAFFLLLRCRACRYLNDLPPAGAPPPDPWCLQCRSTRVSDGELLCYGNVWLG